MERCFRPRPLRFQILVGLSALTFATHEYGQPGKEHVAPFVSGSVPARAARQFRSKVGHREIQSIALNQSGQLVAPTSFASRTGYFQVGCSRGDISNCYAPLPPHVVSLQK